MAVIRALSDFEVLTSSAGGPISGVDRIHTALHGYLRTICDEAGITYSESADIAALFQLIREQHPKFQTHPPGVEATKILRGLARVIDALNPVRNRHSMGIQATNCWMNPRHSLQLTPSNAYSIT